ncbi:glutamine cyclotransferase [Bacteroidia bacterium]|nr:glutamine cyclotransferase [Bacteroidia bacterium]GHT84216.1 glutamine cyclotransferase [Bacteroidia bacterium]GHV70541.1 glutamine cyclotransferase [Bacteroidia bacterium]
MGCACKQPTKTQDVSSGIDVPVFNADSAYQYTANQVSFGPRVPNTPAHVACGNYLADALRRFGAEVIEQETTLSLLDNTPIQIKNIIGSFQPENKNRVLLFAHWDSRPYADNDPNPDNHNKPIDGANDGAGACAALLEIARQTGIKQPAVGIDIIFFDAEDWGVSNPNIASRHYGQWCMGSKYWAQNPHIPNYTAKYGILLDMVSAPGAQFYKEYTSVSNAPHVVKKVWEAARATGYDSYFVNENGQQIEDDHAQVIKYRNIPCIDIIQYDSLGSSGFGAYWHTLDDNMNNVSKETLQAVGQTVLYVLHHEK